jgi:hypothetical protein
MFIFMFDSVGSYGPHGQKGTKGDRGPKGFQGEQGHVVSQQNKTIHERPKHILCYLSPSKIWFTGVNS